METSCAFPEPRQYSFLLTATLGEAPVHSASGASSVQWAQWLHIPLQNEDEGGMGSCSEAQESCSLL